MSEDEGQAPQGLVVDQVMLESLQVVLAELRQARPDYRCERSRRYVVTITEMEKILAYFKVMVADCIFAEVARSNDD